MVSPRKRRRKIAGPKLAPFIPLPMVRVLSDTEWQSLLELLPSRSSSETLRGKLDELLVTYLGCLEGEARSPSSREVATVLEDVARRAHHFAKDLCMLAIRTRNQDEEWFNSPTEVASFILADVMLKTEGRSALQNAMRANELLARAAGREAKELAESSKKGKPTHGIPTGWMLRRLTQLLSEHGVDVSERPKSEDPIFSFSKHFLRAALTRASALKGADWATQEIKYALMLSDPMFIRRLRQAAEIVSES